jgi:hypothetical protein
VSVTIADDDDGHQRTSVDQIRQLKVKMRKHERQIAFPDTEEVTGSNPVRPTVSRKPVYAHGSQNRSQVLANLKPPEG